MIGQLYQLHPIETISENYSMKNYKIALLAGDGIGPEIMREAVKIFRLIEERNDVVFTLIEADFGAAAYFKCGHPFPEETKAICDEADAIIKGPIGLSHEESEKNPGRYAAGAGRTITFGAGATTRSLISVLCRCRRLSHIFLL